MKANLSLLWEFLKLSIKQSTQFRGTWCLGVLAQFLNYGATIVSLYIVILSLGEVKGWSASEMIFIYALSLLAYAIAASIFYGPCMVIGSKILNGDLDQTLTKPMSVLIYEIVSNFNIGYISHILLGMTLMAVAIVKMKFHFSVLIFLSLTGIVFCGALIQASMLILASVFCFFMINGNPLLTFIVYQARNFIQYPINIYPIAIQIILTFILPYAFINFYPVVNLLGKADLAIGGAILGWMLPIVAPVLFVMSIIFWNKSLKHYNSSGA